MFFYEKTVYIYIYIYIYIYNIYNYFQFFDYLIINKSCCLKSKTIEERLL